MRENEPVLLVLSVYDGKLFLRKGKFYLRNVTQTHHLLLEGQVHGEMLGDRDRIEQVQDFGIGIAKEHQHKIFERFYQVTDREEKTYPGLGIGLFISCQIVRRHGGQLWVESEKGEGATFHVTLPLSQSHP